MSNVIKTNGKLYGIAGSLSILIIPCFIMLFNNNANIETSQSLCPFKMLTGFPCPGCGITKSIIFFYKGDFSKSIHYHLFGPLTILFCVIAVIVLTIELLTKKDFFQKFLYNKMLAYFIGTTLAIYHLTRIFMFISKNSIDDILGESIWK